MFHEQSAPVFALSPNPGNKSDLFQCSANSLPMGRQGCPFMGLAVRSASSRSHRPRMRVQRHEHLRVCRHAAPEVMRKEIYCDAIAG